MYGLVSNSWADVDVTTYSGENYSYAGGFVSSTNRATIINSYALGDVHADAAQTNRAEAGGFVGLDGGVCINCYARGNVEIVSKYSMYLGGFAGMAASTSEQRLCYYNSDADQLIAGNPVEEKQYAGKTVNEVIGLEGSAKTLAEISGESFRNQLEENRNNMSETIIDICRVLGADENGSSRYESVYYHGDGSDLNPWHVKNGVVGFIEEVTPEKPNSGSGSSGGSGKPVVTPPVVEQKTETVFQDVPVESYYAEAVSWAVEKGITKGTTDTMFSPNAACTRAQAITFLYRAAGEPEVSVGSTFSDVVKGSYYEKAVAWAVEGGITEGTGETTFSPDQICTRAQIVTFLARFAGVNGAADSVFTDVSVDAYYAGSVAWAAKAGITDGTSDTTFSPDAPCTRAQVVTFLWRYMGL